MIRSLSIDSRLDEKFKTGLLKVVQALINNFKTFSVRNLMTVHANIGSCILPRNANFFYLRTMTVTILL